MGFSADRPPTVPIKAEPVFTLIRPLRLHQGI